MVSSWRCQLQPADAMEHLDAGAFFELHPEIVGPKHQGDVIGTFRIGVTNDPRLPAVRTPIVHMLELLKHQRLLASLPQLPCRGSPHRPATQHNRSVMLLRVQSKSLQLADRAIIPYPHLLLGEGGALASGEGNPL